MSVLKELEKFTKHGENCRAGLSGNKYNCICGLEKLIQELKEKERRKQKKRERKLITEYYAKGKAEGIEESKFIPSLSDLAQNTASVHGGNKEALTTSSPVPPKITIKRTEQWEYTASGFGLTGIGGSEDSAELGLLRKVIISKPEPLQMTEEPTKVIIEGINTQGEHVTETVIVEGTKPVTTKNAYLSVGPKKDHWKNLSKSEAEECIKNKTRVWFDDELNLSGTIDRTEYHNGTYYINEEYKIGSYDCSLLNKEGRTPDE